MARATLEVAHIFRQYGEAYRRTHPLPLPALRVMRAIEICRTAALGGHVDECGRCGQQLISYNSCRNRHCPKCGSLARARWIEQRQRELLPVEYFHVVFTIPAELNALVFHNQRLLYDLLFRVSMDVLSTIGRDRRHLGAETGFFGILHTWGQNLLFHPHIHYVVPGGGLGPDHDRWIACRPGFFLPVRVLSASFRELLLDAIETLFADGQLQFFGEQEPLHAPEAFRAYLAPLRDKDWVVYAKAPFGGPQQVLDYLGRYTHRVAISNERLLSLTHGQVTFQWKDYRHPQRPRVMTVSAEEFIRRFLLHTLPDGFQRIRFGGFLANCHRRAKLACIRPLLATPVTDLLPLPKDTAELLASLTGAPAHLCPCCGLGQLIRVEVLAPVRWRPPGVDSS
jgi:predicted RNA-binding Zn-ribbon protein involved in translation (DUF1610 family)